jgi:hypothetical protein
VEKAVCHISLHNFHAIANFHFAQESRLAIRFNGDLIAAYVYSAFLVASAADSLRILHSGQAAPAIASTRLSAQSISEMTQIPRETVRRKCRELALSGTIQASPGALYECAPTAEEIADLVAPYTSLSRLLR